MSSQAIIDADQMWPRMVRLAGCVCERLAEAELQDVCFCGVMPGAVTDMGYFGPDGCGDKNGMAYVRLVTAYPSVSFPQPVVAPIRCNQASLAMTVEVGIVRTFYVMDDEGQVQKSMEDITKAASQQMLEAQVIREAVLCCYGEDVVFGTYTPIGGDQPLVGGYWLVTLDCDDDALVQQ